MGKYLKLGPYYFATEVEKGTRKIGKDQIGLSGVQREFLQVQENSDVSISFPMKYILSKTFPTSFSSIFFFRQGDIKAFCRDHFSKMTFVCKR